MTKTSEQNDSEPERLVSRLYAYPSNGWEETHPDGSIPVHIANMLNQVFPLWFRNEEGFNLTTHDGEDFIWVQGESLIIDNNDQIVNHFVTEEFMGFPIFDKSDDQVAAELQEIIKKIKPQK